MDSDIFFRHSRIIYFWPMVKWRCVTMTNCVEQINIRVWLAKYYMFWRCSCISWHEQNITHLSFWNKKWPVTLYVIHSLNKTLENLIYKVLKIFYHVSFLNTECAATLIFFPKIFKFCNCNILFKGRDTLGNQIYKW